MSRGILKIQHYLDLLEQSENNLIDNLGQVERQVGPEIQVIIPNDPELKTIIINRNENVVTSISFGGPDFKIYYPEITEQFGKIDVGYNWRDNYTAFFVNCTKHNKVKKISFKIDGEVEIVDGFYTHNNDGHTTENNGIKELCFKNFTFEF
jgi:hypothetical protein